MLRKRSRTVTSKQAIAGDQQWLPPEKSTKPTSFFFNSPRILKGFFTISYENESVISPTSILDTKPFSALTNTFWAEKKSPNPNPKTRENKHSWEQPNNSKGIGIALFDDPESENLESKQNQKRKLVVFGSQLRIQVPTSSVFPCSSSSPESAGEFGIKTPTSRSNLRVCEDGGAVERENTISIIDMEKSEDYTCVISHGPNPKTTHIFGNCIVEGCCGVDGCSSSSSSSSYRPNGFFSLSSENFLSFCHHCKRQLQQGEDIYMYRGDKAFCSEECRCQEMLYDGLES